MVSLPGPTTAGSTSSSKWAGLLLYCFRYDPTTGKYGAIVMNMVRVAAILTVIGVVTLILVLRRVHSARRDIRLSEVIGLRGGPSKFAAKNRIRIIRIQDGMPIVLAGDLGRIEKGDLSSDVALHTGDIVVVPPTLFAMVGYKISALLFPFSPILSAMAGAGLASLF